MGQNLVGLVSGYLSEVVVLSFGKRFFLGFFPALYPIFSLHCSFSRFGMKSEMSLLNPDSFSAILIEYV